VHLDWAILSDFAEVSAQGLFYNLGGGWDTGNRSEFPAPFGGALSIRVLYDRLEVSRPHTIEIHFVDVDGNAIVPAMIVTAQGGQIPPGWPVGWDIPLMFVVNMHSVMVPRPGNYALNILIDGQHLKNMPLRFLQQAMFPPGMQPSPPAPPPPGTPGHS
jgi:hypothetical protein